MWVSEVLGRDAIEDGRHAPPSDGPPAAMRHLRISLKKCHVADHAAASDSFGSTLHTRVQSPIEASGVDPLRHVTGVTAHRGRRMTFARPKTRGRG